MTETIHKILQPRYALVGHKGKVNSVAFSPDGKIIATGGHDSKIIFWATLTGEMVGSLEGHYRSIESIAFSPDGKLLAGGGFDQSFRIWNVETKSVLKRFTGHTDVVTSVAFSRDGKMIASGSADKSIRIWSVESGETLKVMEGYTPKLVESILTKVRKKQDDNKGHTSCVTSVAFSHDGNFVASGCKDETVKYWSVETGQLVWTLRGHGHPVSSIAFSPNGELIASGSTEDDAPTNGSGKAKKQAPEDDKTIRIWSSKSGYPVRIINTKTYDVKSISFSPDGKLIATGGWDYTQNRNTIRLWSVETGELIRPYDGHFAKVASVAFSPDGRMLSSVGDDKIVKLFNVE
jgi:WD40 repeat protein